MAVGRGDARGAGEETMTSAGEGRPETSAERAIRAGCAAQYGTPCPQADVLGACPNECVVARIVRAALTAIRVGAHRDALEAVLLFQSASPWTPEKQARWAKLTGEAEATTRALCDAVRRALG
jgi:hypothetical protein